MNPASLTISDYWCDANCAPILKGADLVVGRALRVSPASVRAGQLVQVGGYSASNNGTLSPVRAGTASTSHRIRRRSIRPQVAPTCAGHAPRIAGLRRPLKPFTRIPRRPARPIVAGAGVDNPDHDTRHLVRVLYADDLRTVSELNETNNITLAASFTVTSDTTPPVFAPFADVTAEASGPTGAIVSYPTPTAIDAVDGVVSVMCTPHSGGLFPLNSTTARAVRPTSRAMWPSWTFAVIVSDTTPPVLALPAPVVPATSASGAIVTFIATANDLVDGPRPISCAPASGSSFPIGLDDRSLFRERHRAVNTTTGSFAVTVTLQYGFVAVQNLPPPAGKTIKPGSSVPLVWQFTIGGVAVDSSNAKPRITIAGPGGATTFTPANTR